MRTHNSERVSDWLGGCDPHHLVAEFGTPLLAIDEALLRSRMRRFRDAFTEHDRQSAVTYAGKALLLPAIARVAHEEDLLVDVCSLGELETALRAGVPPQRCIQHGCFKTAAELDAAIARDVGLVVVDNRSEMDDLDARARAGGKQCNVLVRVNPGISAATHAMIQTGSAASKFGFSISGDQAIEAVRRAQASAGLRFLGIHCHIGSQITDMRTYERAIEVLVDFAKRLHAEGGAICAILNVGGGLAAGEQHESAGVGPEAWASTIFSALEGTLAGSALPRPRIFVEPGRSVVAAAGTTLYRIGVRKTMPDGSEALIVDGGLSDNPRPALYEARYSVRLVGRAGDAPDGTYTVFGRHCETDLLFPAVALPDPQPGDLLAVSDTGAYTYSMASNYNRFSRPAVVLARDGRARLIARREPLEHVLDLDVIETA